MQVLVLQKYQQALFQIARALPMGGHLGRDKTKPRLTQWLFWTGIYKQVENYCQSCPKCQRASNVQPPRVALVPMLMVKRPFDRIAMDIATSIPKE